jgi:hypothetical protein
VTAFSWRQCGLRSSLGGEVRGGSDVLVWVAVSLPLGSNVADPEHGVVVILLYHRTCSLFVPNHTKSVGMK